MRRLVIAVLALVASPSASLHLVPRATTIAAKHLQLSNNFKRQLESAAVGILVAAVTASAPALALPPMNCDSFGCYPAGQRPGAAVIRERPPAIDEHSSARALKVGKALKAKKATMYGAYWCGFCNLERQALGQEAFAMVEYVECDPKGVGGDPQRCFDAGIDAYPAWQLGPGQAPQPGALGLSGLERQLGIKSLPMEPARPPVIAAASSPEALEVGKALKAKKATMYGTYWCGFCNQERQALGREAFGMVEYVECDPRGVGGDPKRCAAAEVEAFPTWQLGAADGAEGQAQRPAAGALGLEGLKRLAAVKQ